MSRVIPKPELHQTSSYQSRSRDFWKTLKDVSYSSQKTYESCPERLKHQSLIVRVKRLSLQGTEVTERGLVASLPEDVSISRTKALHQKQNVDKFLTASADHEEDVLDWDFYLENPPLKPTATIELEFEYKGRNQPIPIIAPWDE